MKTIQRVSSAWANADRGVARQQRVVERLKQRFEAFQAAGHGARRHVQAEQPPLGEQPLRGPVAGELVEQDLHPHRDAQQSLGDQLGRRRSGEGSRAVRAGACPLITSPSDASAIRSDLDLDLFGILGVAGRERRPTPRANALLLGQLAEFLDDGQVAVVPPLSDRADPSAGPAWAARTVPAPLRLRDDWSGPGTSRFRSFDRRVDPGACGSRREVVRPRLRVARPDARPERASPSNTRPVAAVRRSHVAVALTSERNSATSCRSWTSQIGSLANDSTCSEGRSARSPMIPKINAKPARERKGRPDVQAKRKPVRRSLTVNPLKLVWDKGLILEFGRRLTIGAEGYTRRARYHPASGRSAALLRYAAHHRYRAILGQRPTDALQVMR